MSFLKQGLACVLGCCNYSSAHPRFAHCMVPTNPSKRYDGRTMTARRFSKFNYVGVLIGLAFLYLPILLLVIYSFNASKLVTVWGWVLNPLVYGALAKSRLVGCGMGDNTGGLGIGNSCDTIGDHGGRCAHTAQTLPWADPIYWYGLCTTGYARSDYRPVSSAFVCCINLDRGFWTVTLAHITFSMCYVAVVVQSRLATFDPSLEEAARDLGATPLAAFSSNLAHYRTRCGCRLDACLHIVRFG